MAETVAPPGIPVGSEPASELRTFLFADVRGYTRFTQERGDEAAAQLVAKFVAVVREGVRARGGQVVEIVGDEAFAVFGSARQALRAAVDLQTRFVRESEKEPALALPVGIGLDAGEAVRVEGGYRGDALNLASRLCNLAGPGEILASEGVVYLGRRVAGVSYAERGLVPLKGFVEPVRVIRVIGAEGDRQADAAAPLTESQIPRQEAPLPIGGFLGALPSGVLVGREREWEHVMTALDDVSKGTGRLVLLSGEPGIGKTRIAQEVTLKARHWGFLVATGRCYEQEQSVPYFPFVEALAAVYAACPPALQIEIPRRWPYVARLLPDQVVALDAYRSEEQYPDQEDQQRLFRAVSHLLEGIAEVTPVAILLDDLHWADESTLRLLQHLARSLRASRVLLLGTYRDVEIHRQHPLEPVLLDLGREGLLDEVEIRRLDHQGTAGLMSEILGHDEDLRDLVSLVHRRTDGNAFFIQEMLRAMVERGDVYRKDGRWERRQVKEMEVPKSIRSLIGQRLSRLEPRAQEILREASVLGQEFSFDDLQVLIELGPGAGGAGGAEDGHVEEAIDAALEQAMLSGLVRETGPEHYAFNHALTQQALYGELTTRRRKRLHLAAGTALERLAERPRKRRAGELEWHFLEADDAARALPYALLAGDQAEEVFANGDAERHYRTALELSRELGDEPREVEALEKLADVLAIEARYDEALDLFEEAVRLYQKTGDREGEARVVAQMGHVHYVRETPHDGIVRLCFLVEALEKDTNLAQPSDGLAALWAALARLYGDLGTPAEQLRAADRAVELSRAVGNDRLLLSTEVSRSYALYEMGDDEEALRVLESVIPRAEQAGDMNSLARALNNLGMYYARRGDMDKERQFHLRALDVSERRGDRGQIVLGSMALSMYAVLSGDWGEARDYIERAERVIEGLGSTPLATWPTSARGWMALREGDLAAATTYAGEALRMADQVEPEWRRLVRRLWAEIEILSGRPEKALEWLTPSLEQSGWRDDAAFLETLAWAHLEAGDLPSAADVGLQAVERARALRARHNLPVALTTAGRVMAAQERWPEAQAFFDEALLLARGLALPFEEGRALLAYGEMLSAQGDSAESRDLLQQASEVFHRLGAMKDAERVEAALARVAQPAGS